MKNKYKIFLFLIFLAGFILRLYGLNWDQGQHLHPDERMIIMTAEKLTFSNLNPKFFAYGSFPLYLLKFTSWLFTMDNYDSMLIVGRLISIIADILVIVIIYKICSLVFKSKKIALISSFIYSISVLPIQLSHFYAVDTLLNLFIWLTLYFLIHQYQKSSLKHLFLSCLFFSLAISTKISGVVLALPFFLLFVLQYKKKLKLFLITPFLVIFFCFLFQPYAFLDSTTFIKQVSEQQAMTKDAFIFPYTLQYVNTPAYFYPLLNIFLWGFGPIFSIFSIIGAIKLTKKITFPKIILISFIAIYFILTGRFAVKFMRYFLPLYPFLAILAGLGLYKLKHSFRYLLIYQLFWVLAFMSIYTHPNTRVQATNWIESNMPVDSIILREHWDDGLPLGYHQYQYIDLPIYDPDSNQKWQKINDSLALGDYLIIASQRLYTPLSKLTDCSRLPPQRCYPQTKKYYEDLFSGKLNYKLVKEFEVRPCFLGICINDFPADESFTVYDHPKVFIFKKQKFVF